MTGTAAKPTIRNGPVGSPARKRYAVVVPNRYPELAEKFIASVRATHEEMPDMVVVRDGHDATFGNGIKVIDAPQPFIFARNANLGIQYWGSRDVFLCNDDIELVEPDTFPILHAISHIYGRCGMLSPLIKGGVGNRVQDYYAKDEVWKDWPEEMPVESTLCFPCVLLRRRMINAIGLLDENFTGYGMEDMDYSIRAYRAGFWGMVTRTCHVVHGDGRPGQHRGDNYSVSFARGPMQGAPTAYFLTKYPEFAGSFTPNSRPTGNRPRVNVGGLT